MSSRLRCRMGRHTWRSRGEVTSSRTSVSHAERRATSRPGGAGAHQKHLCRPVAELPHWGAPSSCLTLRGTSGTTAIRRRQQHCLVRILRHSSGVERRPVERVCAVRRDAGRAVERQPPWHRAQRAPERPVAVEWTAPSPRTRHERLVRLARRRSQPGRRLLRISAHEPSFGLVSRCDPLPRPPARVAIPHRARPGGCLVRRDAVERVGGSPGNAEFAGRRSRASSGASGAWRGARRDLRGRGLTSGRLHPDRRPDGVGVSGLHGRPPECLRQAPVA